MQTHGTKLEVIKHFDSFCKKSPVSAPVFLARGKQRSGEEFTHELASISIGCGKNSEQLNKVDTAE